MTVNWYLVSLSDYNPSSSYWITLSLDFEWYSFKHRCTLSTASMYSHSSGNQYFLSSIKHFILKLATLRLSYSVSRSIWSSGVFMINYNELPLFWVNSQTNTPTIFSSVFDILSLKLMFHPRHLILTYFWGQSFCLILLANHKNNSNTINNNSYQFVSRHVVIIFSSSSIKSVFKYFFITPVIHY